MTLAKKIIPLQPRIEDRQATSRDERMAETERLTMALIFENPVEINGIEYTMDDVLRELFFNMDNRIELQTQLLALFHAKGDDIDKSLSRFNRLLIAGARELAFKLSGEILASQGKAHA